MLNKKLSIAIGRVLAKKARLKKKAIAVRKVKPSNNILRSIQPQLPSPQLGVLHMLIGAFGATLKAKVKTHDGKIVEKPIDNVLPENIMVKQHESDDKKKENKKLLASLAKEAKENKDEELSKAVRKALKNIDSEYLSLEEIKDNLKIYEKYVPLKESDIYTEQVEIEKREEVLVYYGLSLEKFIKTIFDEITQMVNLNQEGIDDSIKNQIETKRSKLSIDLGINDFFLGSLIKDKEYAKKILRIIKVTSLKDLDQVTVYPIQYFNSQTREILMVNDVFVSLGYLKALHEEKFGKLDSYKKTSWKPKSLVDAKPHLFTLAASIQNTKLNSSNQIERDKDGRRISTSEKVEPEIQVKEFLGTSNYKSILTKSFAYEKHTFKDIITSFLIKVDAMQHIQHYFSLEQPETEEQKERRLKNISEQQEMRRKQLHQVFAISVNDKELNPFEVIKDEVQKFKNEKKEEIKDQVKTFKTVDGIVIDLTVGEIFSIVENIQNEKLVSYVDYVKVPYDTNTLPVGQFEKNEESFKNWCSMTHQEISSSGEMSYGAKNLEKTLNDKYYTQFGLTPPVSSNDIYIDLNKCVRTPGVENFISLYGKSKDSKEVLTKALEKLIDNYGSLEEADEEDQLELMTKYKNLGLNLPFVTLDGDIKRLTKIPASKITTDNIAATLYYAKEAVSKYEEELFQIKTSPSINPEDRKIQLEKFKNDPNILSTKEKNLYAFYLDPESALKSVVSTLTSELGKKDRTVSLFQIYPECSNINTAYLKYLSEINNMILDFKWTPQYKFAALEVTQKNYRDLAKRFIVQENDILDFTKKLVTKWDYILDQTEKLPISGQTVLPIFEKKIFQINSLRNKINEIEKKNARKREKGSRQQNLTELEQLKNNLKAYESEYESDKKAQQYEPLLDSIFNPKTQTGARSSISLWGETGKGLHSYLSSADSTQDFLSILLNGYYNTLNTIFKRARQLDYQIQTRSEVQKDRLALPEFMKNIMEVKGFKNDELLAKFNNDSIILNGFSNLSRTTKGQGNSRETIKVFKDKENDPRLKGLISTLKESMQRRDISYFYSKAEEILESKNKAGIIFKDELGLKIPTKDIMNELLSNVVKTKVNGVRLVSDLEIAERVTTYNKVMTFTPYNVDDEGNEVGFNVDMIQADSFEQEHGRKQRRAEKAANFMKVVSVLATDNILTSKLVRFFGTDTIVRTSKKQEIQEVEESAKQKQELKTNLSTALVALVSFRQKLLGNTYQENTEKILNNNKISLLDKMKIVLKYESNFDGTPDPEGNKTEENKLKIALENAMIEYNEGYSDNFGLDFTLDLKKAAPEEINTFLFLTLALSVGAVDFNSNLSEVDLQDWFLSKVEAKASVILEEYKKQPELNILIETKDIQNPTDRYAPLLNFFIKLLCKNTTSVNDFNLNEKQSFISALGNSAYKAYEYFMTIAANKEVLKKNVALTKESLELHNLIETIGLESYLELERKLYNTTSTLKTKNLAILKAEKIVQAEILNDLKAFFTKDLNLFESNLLESEKYIESLFRKKQGNLDSIELNIGNVSGVINTIMLKFYVFMILGILENPFETFNKNPEWWQLFSLKGTSQNKKLKSLVYLFKTELKSLITRVELTMKNEELSSHLGESSSTPKLSIKVLKDNSDLRKREVVEIENSFGDALATYLSKNEVQLYNLIEDFNKNQENKRPEITFNEIYEVIEKELANGNLNRLIEIKAKYTDSIEEFKDKEVSYQNQVTPVGKKLIDSASKSNFLNANLFKAVSGARVAYSKQRKKLEKTIENVSKEIEDKLKEYEDDPNYELGYYRGVKKTLEDLKFKLSNNMEGSINKVSPSYEPSKEEVSKYVILSLLEKNLKKDVDKWSNPEIDPQTGYKNVTGKSELMLLLEETLKQKSFSTYAKYVKAGEYQSFDSTNAVFDNLMKEKMDQIEQLSDEIEQLVGPLNKIIVPLQEKISILKYQLSEPDLSSLREGVYSDDPEIKQKQIELTTLRSKLEGIQSKFPPEVREKQSQLTRLNIQLKEIESVRYDATDVKQIQLAKSEVANVLYSNQKEIKKYLAKNGDLVKTNLAKEMYSKAQNDIVYGKFKIDGYSEFVSLLEEKIFKEKREGTKQSYQEILDQITYKVKRIVEKAKLSAEIPDRTVSNFKNEILVVIGEINTLINKQLSGVNNLLEEISAQILEAHYSTDYSVDEDGNEYEQKVNILKIKEEAIAKLKELKNKVNEKELIALKEILKRGISTLYLVAEELLSEIDNIKDEIQKSVVNPFLTELKESNYNALTSKV